MATHPSIPTYRHHILTLRNKFKAKVENQPLGGYKVSVKADKSSKLTKLEIVTPKLKN